MDNSIYPLPESEIIDDCVPQNPVRKHYSVNQRLAPIFKALADDPDGWEKEGYVDDGDGWQPTFSFPTTHNGCDNFRLVPKHKTISVEIPVPDDVKLLGDGNGIVQLTYRRKYLITHVMDAIRKAMERK